MGWNHCGYVCDPPVECALVIARCQTCVLETKTRAGAQLTKSTRQKKSGLAWLLAAVCITLAPSAVAQPDGRCLQALQKADPTDSHESLASHFSHESVWKVRDRLWTALSAWQRRRPEFTRPWQNYLQKRYGRFFDRYAEHPEQWMSLQDRIDAAGRGAFAELGELQIAEKYLADPQVRTVEFIPQSQVDGLKSPDLHVFFVNGDTKFVEVKTRTPGELPDFVLLSIRLEAAEAQVASYKDAYPKFRNSRADVEVVHHYPELHQLTREQIQRVIVDIAEFWFEDTEVLTRLILHFNGRPFVQLTHRFEKGEWRVHTVFLKSPQSKAPAHTRARR